MISKGDLFIYKVTTNLKNKVPSKKMQKQMILFLAMLLFKCALEYGYWNLLSIDKITYTFDFNYAKYINGFICCTILFWGIEHEKKKVSSFFLYMIFLLQIIPITVIYSLGNDNALYYNCVCFGFLICEFLVSVSIVEKRNIVIKDLSNIVYVGLVFLLVILVFNIIKTNGKPSLTALNIYAVYELRSSGAFSINKYLGYILNWSVTVILPLIISKKLVEKKYISAIVFCAIIFILYLYTGSKTYLFSIPLIIVAVLWAARENFYYEIFTIASIGFSIMTFLSNKSSVLYEIFSLIGRRVMLLSANNKFKYFDFFSKNEKMGIAGIFPTWIINVENPYPEGIGYIIAREYFNNPVMNSNTGFLAEGYMRFGWFGLFLSMILLAVILRMMDSFEKRNGYRLCIGCCIYIIFMLSDAHLMDSLVLGPWMLMIMILLVYKEKKTVSIKIKSENRRGKKC